MVLLMTWRWSGIGDRDLAGAADFEYFNDDDEDQSLWILSIWIHMYVNAPM